MTQQPDIMLADEPVASLDPPTAKVVMDYLLKFNRELGITTLVNLHDVELAKEYARRIVGIRAGEIVFDGKPSELTREVLIRIYGKWQES